MTSEEINKLNENPGVDRIIAFIKMIENDGYNYDYVKMTELTDIIARGGQDPIKNYNTLKELEVKMGNIDEETTKFRYETRDALDKVFDLVSKDSKFDGFEKLQRMFKNIKIKLGVIQAVDRVAEAEASRAKTKAAIAALGSNKDLTSEQISKKNEEYKRLLLIYNGPNYAAIQNAKKIASMQEKVFSNISIDFIDELGRDLKESYDYLIMMNLSPETKKTLIDEFNHLLKIRNEYKGTLAKYNSNLKLHQNIMSSLGLSVSSRKSFDKKTPKQDNEKPLVPEISELEKNDEIFKMSDMVVFKGKPYRLSAFENSSLDSTDGLEFGKTYKIVKHVIINSLTYYQLENMGDKLYNASYFEQKEKNKNIESITKDPVKPAKPEINNDLFSNLEENPLRVRERNIPSPKPREDEESFPSLAKNNLRPRYPNPPAWQVDKNGVLEETASPKDVDKPRKRRKVTKQTPAANVFKKLGSAAAIAAKFTALIYLTGAILIPASGPVAVIAALIYAYQDYKIYALKKQMKGHLTPMQRMFPFLIKKATKKIEQPDMTPEEKNELNDLIDEMQKIENEKEKSEPEITKEESNLDEEIKLTQDLMDKEGLTREESVERVIEASTDPEVKSELTKGGK